MKIVTFIGNVRRNVLRADWAYYTTERRRHVIEEVAKCVHGFSVPTDAIPTSTSFELVVGTILKIIDNLYTTHLTPKQHRTRLKLEGLRRDLLLALNSLALVILQHERSVRDWLRSNQTPDEAVEILFDTARENPAYTEQSWREWVVTHGTAIPDNFWAYLDSLQSTADECGRKARVSYNTLMNYNIPPYTTFVNFTTDPVSGAVQLSASTGETLYRCHDTDRGCPAWEEIGCREVDFAGFHLKTVCMNPVTKTWYLPDQYLKAQKVFVFGYENFFEYLRALQEDSISFEQHYELFTYLYQKGGVFVNHNRDVNILHFKFA